MPSNPRILAFSGSLRADSYNRKLVHIAAEAARRAGADVTEIALRDYPLPVFDEDLEAAEGIPESAMKLKGLLKEHDGFLISCPEYNSSITAALKNAIDWASRPVEGETPLECFAGKVAALMAASPGGTGGLRGLVHVRAILGNIRVLVLPEQKALPNAHKVFNGDGSLNDPKQQASVEAIGQRLAEVVGKLGSG